MKRLIDLVLALIAASLLLVPIVVVAVLVKLTSKGPALYWSNRVGMYNTIFKMPKFRSMKIKTPAVATHLLLDPGIVLTPLGDFLRKSSLDELPQLWCILKGEMSFVGPRPALFNQDDLIAMRTEKGVDQLTPGLTGWAQVNGWRGNTSLEKRIEFDLYYIKHWSLLFDMKILFLTIWKGLINRHAY